MTFFIALDFEYNLIIILLLRLSYLNCQFPLDPTVVRKDVLLVLCLVDISL